MLSETASFGVNVLNFRGVRNGKPWLGQWLGVIPPVAISSPISLRPAVILPLGKGAVQAVLVRRPSLHADG